MSVLLNSHGSHVCAMIIISPWEDTQGDISDSPSVHVRVCHIALFANIRKCKSSEGYWETHRTGIKNNQAQRGRVQTRSGGLRGRD